MPECLVSDVPAQPDPSLQTWGERLAGLDVVLGQVVTAARFDGVDQPSFREADIAACALATVARIELDAADSRALLRNTLQMAVESLPVLAESACRTAQEFRTANVLTAHRQLPAVIDAVQTLMRLTKASAIAAGVNLDRV